MSETKKPEHIKPRVGPKPVPPTESWWTVPDSQFAERQREEQKRMSGVESAVFAKANGEDES